MWTLGIATAAIGALIALLLVLYLRLSAAEDAPRTGSAKSPAALRVLPPRKPRKNVPVAIRVDAAPARPENEEPPALLVARPVEPLLEAVLIDRDERSEPIAELRQAVRLR